MAPVDSELDDPDSEAAVGELGCEPVPPDTCSPRDVEVIVDGRELEKLDGMEDAPAF